ncbi:hypothetical protein [Comamonas terrigena]|uniref:hypothetical protein n=1 Tax=Comamonas terrigena TaxID=32013 RepID=UPI00244D3443|nr:hypothetical protein [Comamonas terrigena]MDH1703083.1 hypothetical protein [Comamonas terrigena]
MAKITTHGIFKVILCERWLAVFVADGWMILHAIGCVFACINKLIAWLISVDGVRIGFVSAFGSALCEK